MVADVNGYPSLRMVVCDDGEVGRKWHRSPVFGASKWLFEISTDGNVCSNHRNISKKCDVT